MSRKLKKPNDWTMSPEDVKFKLIVTDLPTELHLKIYKTILFNELYLKELVYQIGLSSSLDWIISELFSEHNLIVYGQGENSCFVELETMKGRLSTATPAFSMFFSFIKERNLKFAKAILKSHVLFGLPEEVLELVKLSSEITVTDEDTIGLFNRHTELIPLVTELRIGLISYRHIQSFRKLTSSEITIDSSDVWTQVLLLRMLKVLIQSQSIKCVKLFMRYNFSQPFSDEVISCFDSLVDDLQIQVLLKVDVNGSYVNYIRSRNSLKAASSTTTIGNAVDNALKVIERDDQAEFIQFGLRSSKESRMGTTFILYNPEHLSLRGSSSDSNDYQLSLTCLKIGYLKKLKSVFISGVKIMRADDINLPCNLEVLEICHSLFKGVLQIPKGLKSLKIVNSPVMFKLSPEHELEDISLWLLSSMKAEDFKYLPPTTKTVSLDLFRFFHDRSMLSVLNGVENLTLKHYHLCPGPISQLIPESIKKLTLYPNKLHPIPKTIKDLTITIDSSIFSEFLGIIEECDLERLTIHTKKLHQNWTSFQFKILKELYLYIDCENNPELYDFNPFGLIEFKQFPKKLDRFECYVSNNRLTFDFLIPEGDLDRFLKMGASDVKNRIQTF